MSRRRAFAHAVAGFRAGLPEGDFGEEKNPDATALNSARTKLRKVPAFQNRFGHGEVPRFH